MPRQLPGVMCIVLMTIYSSPFILTHMPFLRPVAFTVSAIVSSVTFLAVRHALHSFQESRSLLEAGEPQVAMLVAVGADEHDGGGAQDLMLFQQRLHGVGGQTRHVGPQPVEAARGGH